METINKAVAQLSDLFRSMTPAARVTAALLLAAVVVSMGYLFGGSGSDAEHLLFGGADLSTGEVQAIEAALSSENIPHDTSGNRVRVAAHQQYEAMGAIAAAGAMPLNLHKIMNDALGSGSIFEGREQAKIRLEIGSEQHLCMVIRSMMPWVEDAAVNFEEKPGQGLQREDLVTAAIALTPVAGQSMGPVEASRLQKLTAAWFGRGLTPDKVQVTDLRGGASGHGSNSLDLAELTDNPYLKDLFLVETHLKDKIESGLRHIRGVQVEVHADLAPELSSQSRTTKYDPKGTTRTSDTESETTTNTTAAPAGPVGLSAQGPQAPDPSQTNPAIQDKTVIERDTTNNLVGSTEQLIQQAGLTPKDMKASIQVPMNWLIETVWENQWRRRPNNASATEVPLPTDQELQTLIDDQKTQIQSHIENLFPEVAAGEDGYPRVVVSFYEATDPAPTPEATLGETAFAWIAAHWTTLFMFGLAIVSLLMLRSMVRKAGDLPATAERPTLKLEVPDVVTEPVDEDEKDERPKLKLNKGPTLKDDLAQLVREDPDTAATILRSWISHAA